MSTKLHRLLTQMIAIIGLTWFFAGFVMFPDAPIQFCKGSGAQCGALTCKPGTYYGKQGQVHSAADFQRFVVWQRGLFVIWPMGFVAGYFLNRARPRL